MLVSWIKLFLFYPVFVYLVGVSGEELQAGEEKRKYLERELLFYKSSARELKRKLKETGADMAKFAKDQERLQNTESSTREQDPLVDM